MHSVDSFYEQIKSFRDFSEFTRSSRYTSLPADWLVVVTDIEGSTEAVQQGRYKDVNSISTASLVVVLNAMVPLKVPYVFGGDGATICIPPSKKEAAMSALIAVKQLAYNSFQLRLRVGMVPMSVITQQGCQILVGKYQSSEYFQQAMFLGDGLRHAELLVKSLNPDNPYILDEDHIEAAGNFEGFECRWNEVPSSLDETVSMIIQVVDQDPAAEMTIYGQVSRQVVDIYGDESNHHPLRPENMSLTLSPQKLSVEARIRCASQNAWKRIKYQFRLLFLSLAGKYLMARNIETEGTDWGRYKQRLIANTDYRKFDGVLRMVLSGTREQRARLTDYLDKLHAERKIVYGIHASSGAIITCLIFDYDTDHIHFLDGSNGGYSMASVVMKQQLNEMYA